MERLYVIISDQLSPIYGCVQGAHAVAQWMLDNHSDLKWKNEYLIFLVGNIEKMKFILDCYEIKYSEFMEPDLDNQITAIAILGNDEKFEHLDLIA